MITCPTLARWLLSILLLPITGQEEEEVDFFESARQMKDATSWTELEKLSRSWLEEDPEENWSAQSYLALSLAGQKKFGECVQAMKDLEAMGRSPEDSVAGVGKPMAEIGSVIYLHCWANWDPEFNRKCWGELFEAYPQGTQANLAASRLLMAALKLGDQAEIRRLEQFFDDRLEAAKDKEFTLKTLLGQYAQAYVRAGIKGDKTMELARRAYSMAWDDAIGLNRYAGAGAEGGDNFALREKCDLVTDHDFNNLALAAVLCEAYDAERNPLAAREAEPGAAFEDATDEVGLAGLRRSRVAVGDYDQDGDPDLCFQGALYRNDKGKQFVDVSADAGLVGRGASALFGDYDNDGDLDLLLAAAKPRLFRNQGKKGRYTFVEVTKESGLGAMAVASTPEGADWFDIDADGFLDFYLAAYEKPMSKGHPDLLARNNGDGTFADFTADSGIGDVAPMCGRGVTASDFDQDGDLDLYISNYRLQVNFLFQNDGSGRLVDRSGEFGVQGDPDASGNWFGHTIGSCFGDVDNDGDFDLFCANLAHPRFVSQGFSNLSMLYMNSGEAGGYRFSDERQERGIRFQETHSDPAFVDFDNDGDLDLSITCIYEGVPSSLYQNDGSGRFTPVTFGSRAIAFNGWGQAWNDFDGDGDLDVVYASGSGVRYFRNQGNDNHYIRVRLQGKKGNRFGVGARVEVETLEDEPRRQIREVRTARGTASQDGHTLHFGLGSYKGKVRIAVTWPNTGKVERTASYINRTVTVKQVKS